MHTHGPGQGRGPHPHGSVEPHGTSTRAFAPTHTPVVVKDPESHNMRYGPRRRYYSAATLDGTSGHTADTHMGARMPKNDTGTGGRAHHARTVCPLWAATWCLPARLTPHKKVPDGDMGTNKTARKPSAGHVLIREKEDWHAWK